MKIKFALIIFIIILFPDTCIAATEYATFKSFYTESVNIGWIIITILALFAAVAVILGAPLSPVVTGIAGWIGGLFGLHGVAATNFGLALLGGGAKIAGGSGIIGGAAILSVALEFNINLITDYTVKKIQTEYNYNELLELSKDMLTLPMPINLEGPEIYQGSVGHLKEILKDTPISSPHGQETIKKVSNYIYGKSYEAPPNEINKISSRIHSLQALLNFFINNHPTARLHAREAINLANGENIPATLPAFIYATSTLYEKEFNLNQVLYYFSFSLKAEPDNPLIPLISSIFLDRMMLRINDEYLDVNAFAKTFEIFQAYHLETSTYSPLGKWLFPYKKISRMIFTSILSRYVILLKLEQHKITSLTSTVNESIKNNPITLQYVNGSLVTYSALIAGAINVYNNLLSVDDGIKSEEEIINFMELLIQYRDDTQRLKSLIDGLKTYQEANNHNTEQPSYFSKTYLIITILVIVILVATLLVAKNRRLP